jgi:hypothetical protein
MFCNCVNKVLVFGTCPVVERLPLVILQEGQQKLELLTANTMESVSLGQQSLINQQEKLRTAQHNIQDFVALNLRQLTREKALIAAGHHELVKMTEDIKKKLG